MNKDIKRILFWFVVAAIIIGGFLAVIFANQGIVPGNGRLTVAVQDGEWWRGDHDSDVILVEYSDFQCPACASHQQLIDELINEFGAHMRLVYRHFPLRSIHKNAQLAAQASEAAGRQGKFWEMHDLLFENQTTWEKQSESEAEAIFTSYALDLSLDIEKFEDDLDSGSVENAVDEDYDSGIGAGVNATPTFFLNGEKINPNNKNDYRTLIREAIEKAS